MVVLGVARTQPDGYMDGFLGLWTGRDLVVGITNCHDHASVTWFHRRYLIVFGQMIYSPFLSTEFVDAVSLHL
jgi:hypothetical protein